VLQKIHGIQESLHYIGLPAQNKHKVFVDSSKEALAFNPSSYFETPKVSELCRLIQKRSHHHQGKVECMFILWLFACGSTVAYAIAVGVCKADHG